MGFSIELPFDKVRTHLGSDTALIGLGLAGPGGLLRRPATWISQWGGSAECEAIFVVRDGQERGTRYTIRNQQGLLDEAHAVSMRAARSLTGRSLAASKFQNDENDPRSRTRWLPYPYR